MNHLKRYCFAIDLRDDEENIGRYEAQHKKVWPEIIQSIKAPVLLQWIFTVRDPDYS
jgi:L-rhamnose mutarotase